MEISTTRVMATTLTAITPMATSPMVDTRATPLLDITMVITTAIVMAMAMGTMDSSNPTQMARETYQGYHATSARSMDTTTTTARN
jgi:hypothetical protein